MEKLKQSRLASFIIIFLIYAAAFLVGVCVYSSLATVFPSEMWRLFIADVAATVFVWFWGLVFKNVSVYDPYWSVLPPVLVTAWFVQCGSFGVAQCLLLVAVGVWAIRLTANWAITFRNLNAEDWRYTKYRMEQKPFLFHIINFFGLNMMPTVLVFLCVLPGLYIIDHVCSANLLTWLGFFVCIGAATIQLVADTQIHRFVREHKGEVCNVGLWKHGRHPNYFGEISMWWGVWIMFVSMFGFSVNAWYVVCPILMTCLFLFISIPLMEKRQLKNKPQYAEYKKQTRILI